MDMCFFTLIPQPKANFAQHAIGVYVSLCFCGEYSLSAFHLLEKAFQPLLHFWINHVALGSMERFEHSILLVVLHQRVGRLVILIEAGTNFIRLIVRALHQWFASQIILSVNLGWVV